MNSTFPRRNERLLRFTRGRRPTYPALLQCRQPQAPDGTVSPLQRQLQHRVEWRQPSVHLSLKKQFIQISKIKFGFLTRG